MRAVQGRLDRIERALGTTPPHPVVERIVAEIEAACRLRHPAPGYGNAERAADRALIAGRGATGYEMALAFGPRPWPAVDSVPELIDCPDDDGETAGLLASLRPAEPVIPPDAPAPAEPPPIVNQARAERAEREARKTRKLRLNIYHQ